MAIKRVCSILLVLALMVTLFTVSAVSAVAAEGPDDGDYGVMPLYEICGCGGTMINQYGSWGAWLNDHEEKCNHGKHYGTDMIQYRYRTVTVKCQSCGQGYSYQDRGTNRVCHGYN